MSIECDVATAFDAALGYATLGWPVLPVAPRGKTPLTAHGLKDACTDRDVIAGWWERWPSANVGIATGPPGPTVIDCDGPIGKHEWSKYIAGIGWESSPWCFTGGGGWHVYYAGDKTVKNRAGWLRKCDVRGVGGYVVAPPSIHASGADYWWDHGPDERALGPLPEIVRSALLARPVPALVPVRPVRVRAIGGSYAARAFDGEIGKVRAAPVGERNATLISASFSLGQLVADGALDPGAVVSELVAVATAAGLPTNEALRTIESGVRAGIDKPRRR